MNEESSHGLYYITRHYRNTNKKISERAEPLIQGMGEGVWHLTPLSTIFQLYTRVTGLKCSLNVTVENVVLIRN